MLLLRIREKRKKEKDRDGIRRMKERIGEDRTLKKKKDRRG